MDSYCCEEFYYDGAFSLHVALIEEMKGVRVVCQAREQLKKGVGIQAPTDSRQIIIDMQRYGDIWGSRIGVWVW